MLKPPTIQNLLFHIPKQHSLCVCLFVDQAPIPWKMDEDHQFIDRLLQIVNFNSFFNLPESNSQCIPIIHHHSSILGV